MFANWRARLQGHIGAQGLVTLCKNHPFLVVGLIIGSYYGYGWVFPKAQPQATTPAVTVNRETEMERQQRIRAARREQEQDASALSQMKTQVDQLTAGLKQAQGSITTLTQKLDQEGQARTNAEKQLAAARDRERTATRRSRETTTRTSTASTAPQQVVATQATSPRTSAPPAGPKAELRILTSDRADTFTLPPANRSEVAYIGAGCYAEGVIATGVMATTRAGGKQDMMIAIKKEAYCPEQLLGPGRPSRVTALPIQGCLLLGEAVGDPASSRVEGRMKTLSCVMTDGAFIEEEIDAYITDIDGTHGVVGTLHRHASAAELKAFLTAMLQEGAAYLGLARSKVVIAGTNQSGMQPFQGIENGLNQLTSYYIQQMNYLLPTLWAPSKTPLYVVFKKGVSLPGLPTTITMTRGQ